MLNASSRRRPCARAARALRAFAAIEKKIGRCKKPYIIDVFAQPEKIVAAAARARDTTRSLHRKRLSTRCICPRCARARASSSENAGFFVAL
jgi:hypothetical protein